MSQLSLRLSARFPTRFKIAKKKLPSGRRNTTKLVARRKAGRTLIAVSWIAISGCAKEQNSILAPSPVDSSPIPVNHEIHSEHHTSAILKSGSTRYRYLSGIIDRSDRVLMELEDCRPTVDRLRETRIQRLRDEWLTLRNRASARRYLDPSVALNSLEQAEYLDFSNQLITLAKNLIHCGAINAVDPKLCTELAYSLNSDNLLALDEPQIEPVRDDY